MNSVPQTPAICAGLCTHKQVCVCALSQERQVRRHQAVARVDRLRLQARSSTGSASSSSSAMLYYEDDFLSEDEAVAVAHSSSQRAVVNTATTTASKVTNSSSSGNSHKGELSSNDTHVSNWDTNTHSKAVEVTASPQRGRAHKSSTAASAHAVNAAAAAQSSRQ
eukprot:12440-Heterococcus_DN1.PRE.2